MDQATVAKSLLSQQVRECLEAGMTVEEGAQYVDIYDDGFRLISNLIKITKFHSDPGVRARADNFLSEFDERGSVGKAYRVAYRFAMINRVDKRITPRKKVERGVRRLKMSEKGRIEVLVDRSDVSAEDQGELKRIQASIFEDKISTLDYDKLRKLSIKYADAQYVKRAERVRARNGWRHVDDKTWKDCQSLLDRPDVSDADKKLVAHLLDGVKDESMKTVDFIDVTRLVANNRASKEERAKRVKASSTFENAVFMACQACDNLDDMKMPVMPRAKRSSLVAKISRAAANILRLQSQLVEEEEDDSER